MLTQSSLRLSQAQVERYLARIGYGGPRDPNVQTLQALHQAHLLAVPFENLSVHLGQRIRLEVAELFEKVVTWRRGGFCYEQNGLFAALLSTLGYSVTLLSGRVRRADGSFGKEFDHLLLRVDLEDPWLVDVGFGDSFRLPLKLNSWEEQRQEHGRFRLEVAEGRRYVAQWQAGEWRREFCFTLQPYELQDFAAMCHFHQTSSESMFARARLCTLATPEGRITLSKSRLIHTIGSQRLQQELKTEAEFFQALQEYYGIALPEGSAFKPLNGGSNLR